VNFASALVKGRPVWNLTSDLSVSVSWSQSGDHCQLVASRGRGLSWVSYDTSVS
jgi:hypothetical protein